MTSSVIPARLEFQCGHAALVSLPRIKHESTPVRNERIAREKNEALSRPCDFCGPVVVQALDNQASIAAPVDSVSVPNNVTEASNGHQPRPSARLSASITAPASPTPEPIVAQSQTPVEAATEPIPTASDDHSEPRPDPIAEPPVAAISVAPKRRGRPPGIRRTVQPTVPTLVATPVAAPAPPQVAVAPRRRGRPPGSRRSAVQAAKPPLSGSRYTVRFVVERVLEAADLQAALRQAVLLGAEEVIEIAVSS